MRLRIDHVVLRRGNRNVINDASYQVAAGEIVALVGANGCGKSTLLAGVAGVLAPVSGQITVDDFDVWGKQAAQYAARARFGYVPENADAPGFVTGGELIALAAAARRGAVPAPEIADALGLAELAPLRIDRMSLGQRRRACLGAAFAGPPQLLILDEPDNGLDVARLQTLTSLLRKFAASGGAVLLASHDQDFATQLDARIQQLALPVATR